MNFEEPKRFWSKVDVGDVDKCWDWLAGKHARGYGAFEIHYRLWLAHRVAWTLTYGPIPEGLYVCHRCDNPICCNPYHLFLGTQRNNIQDAARKGRLNAKLSSEEVLEIRRLLLEGVPGRDLAEKFEVHEATISYIKLGKTWAWLIPTNKEEK